MDKKSHLAALEAESIHIIREVAAAVVNPFTHGSKVHSDVMKTEGLKQAA